MHNEIKSMLRAFLVLFTQLKTDSNFQMMWQGGTWDRNDESRSSPTNILSSIRKIFVNTFFSLEIR